MSTAATAAAVLLLRMYLPDDGIANPTPAFIIRIEVQLVSA